MNRPFLLIAVCLCVLLSFASGQAQPPSLSDARTMRDVQWRVAYESSQFELNSRGLKHRAAALADIYMAAHEKAMELAANNNERAEAKTLKVRSLMSSVEADVEGAEDRLRTFLREFDAWEAAERGGLRSIIYDPAWFLLTSRRAIRQEAPQENFEAFKSNLRRFTLRYNFFNLFETAPYWIQVAEHYDVSAEEFAKWLIEFVQSPECEVFESEKEEMLEYLEFVLRLCPGTDPKLSGKTLNDEDFDWESLRGKYVLIKFTATWCGPCRLALPGMLETYKRYQDKGLEIISVYVWEREDSVALVKKHVADEKIPWIVLSEELATRAGQPEYREIYVFHAVPTYVLVDKEGKIIMPPSHDAGVMIAKLVEIFESKIKEQ